MSGKKQREGQEADAAVAAGASSESGDGHTADGPSHDPANPETAEIDRLRAREDELLRALAEQQNALRRRRQEMDSAVVYAQEELVRDLLPVLDDFERALKAMAGATDEAIRSGVALVYDRIVRILERHGLSPIPSLGEPFDPALHDALAERALPGSNPGTILEVAQTGYRFKDRVLRHAKVVVASSKISPDRSSTSPGEKS
jgi:molecular chaperone GrpE